MLSEQTNNSERKEKKLEKGSHPNKTDFKI